ncbi:MAG: hypothetical protein QUU85_10965, partial [Candidatus Eisenbacteria bacterium]|nr:hypothetical protein [Candidatus Eisenbacteria bacterium]
MDRSREEQKRPPGSPLDPRWEKLVALLYGELPPEEEQSLRMEIESDAALRAEWEEISGARSLLQSWEVPETAKEPSFVFVTPEPARRRNGSARSAATGWRERLSRL